jgi:acetyl esterase/lipase
LSNLHALATKNPNFLNRWFKLCSKLLFAAPHRSGLVFGFCTLLVSSAAHAQSPASAQNLANQLTPAADFFKLPGFVNASLSPQGKFLAFTANSGNGRLALFVMEVKTAGDSAKRNIRLLVSVPGSDVLQARWLNEERILFQLGELDEASGSDYERGNGLFVIKTDGTESKQLIERKWVFLTDGRNARGPLSPDHVLLHVPIKAQAAGAVSDINSIIIGKYQRSRDGVGSVTPFALNVLTMQMESLAVGAPDNAIDWLFDDVGFPRVAVSYAGPERIVHWRDAGTVTWREINRSDALRTSFTPFFVSANQLTVLAPRGPDATAALTRYDFASRAPEATSLVNTPGFDFFGYYLRDRATGKTLGLRLVTDAEQTVWFDPNLKSLQEQTDKRFPGLINRLTCVRCNAPDRVVLNFAFSDQEPGQYWLMQGSNQDGAEPQWQLLSVTRPEINPSAMATVDFVRIKARDGQDLPVWITAPKGRKAGDGGPAVVMVHGGPAARGEYWQWSGMNQFLASRGYVVISPEFRGGTGFGAKHNEAGWKQWGQAMQNDVADATMWARDKGWGDRFCIAGGSYGGYATLMGLVRHDDLYRCGLSFVGATDPFLLLLGEYAGSDDISDAAKKFYFPRILGDAQKDAAMLKANSPVEQAAKIKKPVLLVYGEADKRVPLEHGLRMRRAMQAAGNNPQWVVYPDEGHGFRKPANQLDFASRIETFFATHLK